jgi:ribonucleoside-diphosphate reductase alpha chain
MTNDLHSSDFETNKELGCFATINTDDKPKVLTAPKLVYALTSQGINSDIIRTFVDYFEAGKVRMIRTYDDVKNELTKKDDDLEIRVQCEQITRFIDEVANLKQVTNEKTKSLNIEQNVKSIDKDRYSCIAYMLFYIKMFVDIEKKNDDTDWLSYCMY